MQKKQNKQIDQDDLDNALDQFDNNELNLTGEQANINIDDDPETAAKIKEEYEKFMNEMKNFGMSGNDQQGLDGLTNMLGGLLKNLAAQSGFEGVNMLITQQQGGQLSKGFEQMFKNLKQDNIEQAAGKLLTQFMDKNLLYEPMIEAKQHYDEFFVKQEGKLKQQDQQRYKKQYAILSEIITILDKNPQQKDKLIQLFQKMQELGSPPQGIASAAAFM